MKRQLFFYAVIVVTIIQGCERPDNRPRCCQNIDTTKLQNIDTAQLQQIPYFKTNKRFYYLDSLGNELEFQFLMNSIDTMFDRDDYTGICECDDNYLQEKEELYEEWNNQLVSTDFDSWYFEIYVYYDTYPTPTEKLCFKITHVFYNSTQSLHMVLEDYHHEMDSIELGGNIYENVRLIEDEQMDIIIMVFNLHQGIVAFRDNENKLWTLDRIENIK